MASNKNSFVLYCDLINTVEKLSNEDAGKLFKHILNYVNDNDPEADDLLIEIAFEPIKQALKRDLEKYERRCKANRKNASKGGKAKAKNTQTKQDVANASECLANASEQLAKVPDSDSDSDSDSDKEKEKSKNKFSDEDLTLSKFIFSRIKKLDPKAKEPNLDKWADTIRLLREIDKRSHKDIQDLFLWANQSEFWKSNILSPSSLRKNFTTLQVQRNTELSKHHHSDSSEDNWL